MTCCMGWKISIDNETRDRYLEVEGELGDLLRETVVGERNDYKIKLDEETYLCPIMNENGLCRAQLELGEEALSKTCQLFPRKTWQMCESIFNGLNTACPEVYNMILKKEESIETYLYENDSEFTGEADWPRYNKCVNWLYIFQKIIQRQDINIKTRLRLVLIFSQYIQENFDNDENVAEIFGIFESEEGIKGLVEDLDKLQTNYPSRRLMLCLLWEFLALDGTFEDFALTILDQEDGNFRLKIYLTILL